MTNDKSAISICKHPVVYFALFWLTGFLIGVLLSSGNFATASATVRVVTRICVSFPCKFLTLFLPYAFAFFLVITGKPQYCIWILLVKGISSGFCIYSFAVAFSSASWLMSLLCLYSSLLMLPPLFIVCLSDFSCDRPVGKRDIVVFLLFALILSLIDSFVVSPFIQMLISRF